MIYLDNAATSFPKPEAVYQALDAFARTRLANPGRAGHRMAIGRRADPRRRPARPQPVLPRRGARALDLHAQLHRRPEHGDQGDGQAGRPRHHLRPGAQLVSRPLRALEKAGVITLTRLASDRGYLDPDAIRRALDPDDRAGRPDARHQRARHRAADRGRSRRSSARPGRSSWSTPRRRRASCRSTSAPRRSTCSPSPATRPSTARPAPGPCTSGRAPSPRAWREGGTGGDSSSETQPTQFPYFLEGGTPNVLGVAGLAAGLAWVAERGPENLRRHEVGLLQRVVDWVERRRRLAGRRPLGPGHPRRGALADRPRGPLTRRTSARSSTPASRSPSAPACTAPLTSIAPSGPSPTARSGSAPGPFTTADEIDVFLNALTEITAGVL